MAASWQRASWAAGRLTRNRADADDLIQDTYLKAWLGFGGYRADRLFINWVLRIMQHAYVDRRRLENPIRRAESLNGMMSRTTGEMQETPIIDPSISPLDVVITHELCAEIRRALVNLPTEYRSAVFERDFLGLSYTDIASRAGAPLGTVRSRIHRGRQLLRSALRLRAAKCERPSCGRLGTERPAAEPPCRLGHCRPTRPPGRRCTR